jgi:SAM-dependent methyltransferase
MPENQHLNIFFEIHDGLPRQGPGNAESTTRAFSMLAGGPANKILDVGCGPGEQTVELAGLSGGEVTGLDLREAFLDELRTKASAAGLDERIKGVQGSMFEMPFEKESFDVIWSEGAIYIIGFERGLREWKRFLKPQGFMVASHLSWLRPNAPKRPRLYWERNFSAMASIDGNLGIAEAAGYESVGHFVLPESAWWDEYYGPEEEKLRRLREKYKEDGEALAVIENAQEEIDLYRDYPGYYGYVFYILKRMG